MRSKNFDRGELGSKYKWWSLIISLRFPLGKKEKTENKNNADTLLQVFITSDVRWARDNCSGHIFCSLYNDNNNIIIS